MEESALSRFAALLARLLRDPAGARFGVRIDPTTSRPVLRGRGSYILHCLERYANARSLDLPVPFRTPYQLARGSHLLRLALAATGVDLHVDKQPGTRLYRYAFTLAPEPQPVSMPEDAVEAAEVYMRKLREALLQAIAHGQAERALLLVDRLLVELRLLSSR
jgi:hypothetical protein